MMRRSFLSYGVGMLASVGIVSAQKSIMENKQAVVCPGDSFLCGACKKHSCRTINATMVIGNENQSYPESTVLFKYRVVVCDNYGVMSGLAA